MDSTKAICIIAGKMKKLIAVMGIMTVMLVMAACGGKNKTHTQTQAAKDPNLFTLGDYTLLYKSVSIMDNFDETALVMTLDFTNNSKEKAAFMYSIIEVGKQNGEELEPAAVIVDMNSYDTLMDSQMEEIAPGDTIEIHCAFTITDYTSPVDVTFALVTDTNKTHKMTIDTSTVSRAENPINSKSGGTVADGDALLDWWNGSWYGFWIMTDCTGEYEGMGGSWWDVCGLIDIGQAGGTVTLWEEDMHRGEPMAIVDVSLSADGTGAYGTMYSEGGSFWGGNVGHADWIVDPGLIDLEYMIHIEGQYEGDDGSYQYNIFMRPWGQVWDDVTEEHTPEHYKDWYLPLLAAGKPMPDEFVVNAAQ